MDPTEFMDDDDEANSPATENDQTFEENSAPGPSIQEPVEISNTRTLGQPLSEFLMTLEDYTPTVSTLYWIAIVCFSY